MDYAWWPHKAKRTVASYRLRCAQIVDELGRRGISCGLYEPGVVPKVLVLSKRYDAESVAHALSVREQHGTRIVLDLCDNHFFADDDDPRWRERTELLKRVVAAADLVIASTESLADAIMEACPNTKAITVIGDAAESPHMPPFWRRIGAPGSELRLLSLKRQLSAEPRRRRLVWFGNHGSGYAEGGMLDLQRNYPVLEALDASTPISLTIISNSVKKYRQTVEGWRIKTRYLRWRPETFSRALQMHELCLIPVGVNPFTRSKTNNRVATALLHDLAVVADAIPAYQPFADAIVLDDWERGLTRLLADDSERARGVAAGKRILAADWTLPQIADRWQNALQDLAEKPPR